MDNITHSLVGLAMAEAVVQWRRSRDVETSPVQARALWTAAFLGSNLPDVDVAYTFLTEGRLGYLLHHRGHTHTLVGLIPQFLILQLGLVMWGRRQGLAGRSHALWTAFLVAGGLFSHLFLDALNFYGVHLFWPFDNRWFYGDSLFILEPWLWLALLPGLYLADTTRFVRLLFGATFLIGCLLTLLTGHVPVPIAVVVVLWGSGLWWWIRRFAPGPRITLSLLAMLVPLLGFTALSQRVKSGFQARTVSGLTLHDVALSPMPANPLCWLVLTTETYDQDRYYRIRVGMYAPFPFLMGPARCPTMGSGQGTARLLPTANTGEEGLLWLGEIRNSVKSLQELAARHCTVAAFLRFARMPYFQEAGKDILMGDLRFDRRRGLEFAEIQTLKDPLRCPELVPNWEPPLIDLLSLKPR